MIPITLASGSRYRRELLSRLGLPFECANPNIDETALPNEPPEALVARLAEAKARAVALRQPAGLLIASDQVASLGNNILTKPGNFSNACRQLQECSGQFVIFYTGLALLNSGDNRLQLAVETTEVKFRRLSDAQIHRYVEREQPYDCAGSFKVEGLGISLFETIHGDDPNSLIGLPLIRLVDMLANEGVVVP